MTHYQLTEEQQFGLYQTRKAMDAVIHLCDGIPASHTMQLSSEEASCLLAVLSARLPDESQLKFVVE